MNSTRVLDLTKNVINAWLHIMGPNYYKAKTVQVDIAKFSSPACRENLVTLLKGEKQQFNEACGSTRFALHLEERIFRGILED